MLENKNILIGITGGIAAYKICTLVRLFKKAGANVRVVVTPSALNFVTKLTLQTLSNNEVYVENFNIDEHKPEHIALTDSDIFVIAPASANTIGKIANGICDNLLLSTACAFAKPILLAPAMNENMWNNPFVQENLNKLKSKGYSILEPESGFLACGTNGVGRMREAEDIFDKTVEILSSKQILKNKKILITAGGTREKIDAVRYITNASSGKMGIALADNAYRMGADVTLVSTFKVNKPYKNIVAETAYDMEKTVRENLEAQDCVIMAAAVSDYRVKNSSEQKIKKTNSSLTLELVENPDILKGVCEILHKARNEAGLKSCAEVDLESKSPLVVSRLSTDKMSTCVVPEQQWAEESCAEVDWESKSSLVASRLSTDKMSTCVAPEQQGAEESCAEVDLESKSPLVVSRLSTDKMSTCVAVGFCAESENLIENAKSKIQKKGCDFLIANDISRKDIGFNSDENEIYIIDKNLNIKHIEKDTKDNISKRILEEIFE